MYGELTGTSKEEIISGIDSFELDEEQYCDFPPELWKDKDIIFSCLNAENNILEVFEYVHESLWCDKGFVLDVIDERWYYPNYDREFEDNDFDYFDYIHESLKEDKDIISALNSLKDL